MGKKQIIFLFILAIIVGILLAIVIFRFSIIDKEEIEMFVTVGDHYGMDVSTDKLTFGMMPPSGGGFRVMNLTNVRNSKMIVNIIKEGDIARFVSFENYSFKIKSRESREVKANIAIPENASYGNYSGKLTFYFRLY